MIEEDIKNLQKSINDLNEALKIQSKLNKSVIKRIAEIEKKI